MLARHKPKIVAVTGSVGKTSTKDAIFTALAHTYHARKSEKSFNSELGVPLTILGLPTGWSSPIVWMENIVEGFVIALFGKVYPEWLVLEVGADRPGDITRLAWLRPHIAVLTHFPDVPVHVEFFESPEQVIAEKRELKKALRPNGTLIINADDPKMQDEPIAEGQHRVSYGFGEHAFVRGADPTILYADGGIEGMAASVRCQQQVLPLAVRGALGTHQLYPLLAAITVLVSEGTSLEHALAALEGHVPPPGRMRVLHGIHGCCLVDDTYNASPAAVTAGLTTLPSLSCPGKKIAVLGDMMELGDFSVAEHKKVGELAATTCDALITVGVRMLAAADAARAARGSLQRIESCKDTGEALTILREYVGEGDVVYVKGSQSMRMERVVEELLRDPSEAQKVLVRQDKEWKAKG